MRSTTVLDVGEQVAGEDDGLAAAPEFEDEVLDLPGADGVQARGGLVEDEEFGVVDQGLGDADAPLHALGVLADGPVLGVGQADHVQQLVDAALTHLAGPGRRACRSSRASRAR
jgi:hypothetical protein